MPVSSQSLAISKPIGGQVCDPRTRTCRSAQPLLRVMKQGGGSRFVWLHKGRAGNLQTAAEMAALVREDTFRDEGLREFAVKILTSAGLDSHSDPSRILDAFLTYVQRIRYVADPGGEFDAIHSARETLRKGFGDCDDLSVLLATLLALIGFSPSFVLARYKKSNDGFDHVYLEVPTKQGRIALDPTSRQHGVGWEKKDAIERVVFPIFGAQAAMNGMGNASSAIIGGATVGANFIPVVGPIVSGLIAPIASLFDKTQQRAYESAREKLYLSTVDAIHAAEGARAACQVTPAQAGAAARKALAFFYQACDQNLPKSVAQSCRNYDANGEFTGYINTIEKSPNCASGGDAAQTAGGASASGLGGLSVSLPAVLLLLGGAYLLTRG